MITYEKSHIIDLNFGYGNIKTVNISFTTRITAHTSELIFKGKGAVKNAIIKKVAILQNEMLPFC